eukprot:Nk52_evm19s160 gene=Nk52_evmTU19s160
MLDRNNSQAVELPLQQINGGSGNSNHRNHSIEPETETEPASILKYAQCETDNDTTSIRRRQSIPRNDQSLLAYLPPCQEWFMHRRPGLASEYINLSISMMGVANFYSAIPSGPDYSQRLGAPTSFSGILLAIVPVVSIASNYAWNNLARIVGSFRKVFIAILITTIAANLVYALAATTESPYVLLLSKFLLGCAMNGSISIQWIALSFGREHVRAAISRFTTVVALGIALGAAVAGILSPFDAHLGPVYFDEDTLPGWFFAVVALVHLVIVLVGLDEPQMQVWCDDDAEKDVDNHKSGEGPGETSKCNFCKVRRGAMKMNKNKSKKPVDVPPQNLNEEEEQGEENCKEHQNSKTSKTNISVMSKLKLLAPSILLLAMMVGNRICMSAFEASAPLVTSGEFGWSVMYVCVFLGVLGFSVLPMFYIFQNYLGDVSERRMLIWLFGVNSAGVILMMQYSADFTPYQYSAGGLVLFISITMSFSSIQSLLIKLHPAHLLSSKLDIGVLSITATSLGRGFGSVYGTRFDNLYHQENIIMSLLLAVNMGSLLLVLWFYKQLVPKKIE